MHSTKIIIYLCIDKFIIMQIIYKYRILVIFCILIGQAFLVSLAYTAKKAENILSTGKSASARTWSDEEVLPPVDEEIRDSADGYSIPVEIEVWQSKGLICINY